jgi:hypothetical protein
MSVLNAVPLSGRKTTFVEAPRINEPEACRMSAPPWRRPVSRDLPAGPTTLFVARPPVRYSEGPSWVMHKGLTAGF